MLRAMAALRILFGGLLGLTGLAAMFFAMVSLSAMSASHLPGDSGGQSLLFAWLFLVPAASAIVLGCLMMKHGATRG